MKINTKTPIKDLKGEVIKINNKEDFTVGIALSNILVDAKEGGKMKMFILAQKMYSDDEVDVDDVDLKLIKTAIEQTAQYNNLVNGQLLQILESK